MGRVAMAALMLSACSLDRGSASGQEGPPDSQAALDASSSDTSVSADASVVDSAREAGPTADGAVDGGRLDASIDAAVDAARDATVDAARDATVDAGCPGSLEAWFRDSDGDGAGDDAQSTMACDAPAGYVATGGDCDDGSASVYPGALETCNATDDDCNGIIDDGAGCPCHMRRYMDRPYLFCEESRYWTSARNRCTSVGYDLVVFETLEENDWAWMAAANLSDTHDWWIGLRDEGSDGTYEWVDGTTVWDGGANGFTNFRGNGTPDGSGPCVEMGNESGTSMDGSWNDTPCNSANYFVCEVLE